MQVSFQVPQELVDTGVFVTDRLDVIALMTGAAVVSSIVVQLYKRHYFKKKDIKLAKQWVATWLTATSAFFTFLGYALFLASANMPFLATLPFVGQHVTGVVGIAYILYSLRLNKIYQGASTWLGRWSKSNDKEVSPIPETTATIVSTPTESNQFKITE